MAGIIWAFLYLALERLFLAKSACSSLLRPIGLADLFKPVLTDQLQAQRQLSFCGFCEVLECRRGKEP